MHVVDKEEAEAVGMIAPQLIVFLDKLDIDLVVEELKELGIDAGKIPAKALIHIVAAGVVIELGDYDGKVFYSKRTKEFLRANDHYHNCNRQQRRLNAKAARNKLKKGRP